MSGALNMLLAAGGAIVSIPPFDTSDNFPGVASASISFESDGDVVSGTLSLGSIDIGDWVSPKSAAPGPYEIRATVQSGVTPTGSALNTWLALTSTRSWSVGRGSPGVSTSTILVEIRANGVVLASRSGTLSAMAT